MTQRHFLTVSEAIALAAECGATWQLRIRSRVEDASLRVSLTSSDADSDVALKFGDRPEVRLNHPSQSDVDTLDYFHEEPEYRTEYLLVLSKLGSSAEVRLLDAAQTFNRVFGAWAQLHEFLHDPDRTSEAYVSHKDLIDALQSIGIYLSVNTPNPI